MTERTKRSENLLDMVTEIDETGEGLSQWEISFIAGLIDKPPIEVTEKQEIIIKRIYEERM